MPSGESIATALLLATAGVLLAASVLFSGATRRWGVPVALVRGHRRAGGLGGARPHRLRRLRLRLPPGTVALVLILFDGGLNTPLQSVRMALRPAAVLATLGVVGTAGLMGVAARLSGFAWPQALLLGAVVSSTDAIPLLWPFGYRWPERAYIGWVGLRGAVPVILAIFPVLARAPGAERIFDAVFFIVLVNTVVQGFTVRRGARRELIPARGQTVLQAGDHVYVLCRPEGRSFVHLLFGEAQES